MLWQWRNGVWILNKVYVIGMGPGAYEQMTVAAVEALKGCDVIVGYTVYVDLMKKYFPEKEFMTTPMRKEPERCRLAFEEAKKGRVTAMVCSGDSGIYGMAGLMYEIGEEYPEVEIEVLPGVTAATVTPSCAVLCTRIFFPPAHIALLSHTLSTPVVCFTNSDPVNVPSACSSSSFENV